MKSLLPLFSLTAFASISISAALSSYIGATLTLRAKINLFKESFLLIDINHFDNGFSTLKDFKVSHQFFEIIFLRNFEELNVFNEILFIRVVRLLLL